MSGSLGAQMPFWHFDKDFLVFSDGSLGAGFELKGMDISSMSCDGINTINRGLGNLLASLPEGLSLQVFYQVMPNVGDLICRHKAISTGKVASNPSKSSDAGKTSDTTGDIAQARFSFLDANHRGENYFAPDIFLFARSEPHKYQRQSFWQKDAGFQQISQSQYLAHKEAFQRNRKQLETLLKQIGLAPQSLSKERWFELLFQYFNLSRQQTVGTAKLRQAEDLFSPSLAEQVALTDMTVHKDFLKCGEYAFQVVTMKGLPESSTYASMVETLTKLPFHFWLVQNIHLKDQKKERTKLQVQRRWAHSMATGSQNVSDLESESKFTHTESLLKELLEGSEKLVSSDMNVLFWAKNPSELLEKSQEVLKAFKDMNGAEGIIETLPCLDAFMQSFPGSCRGLRLQKMKSSNASHLMPLYREWQGNRRPVCLLPNSSGCLFSIDPFAPELPNWNGLIFGGSGAGKSFTISQLMLQFGGQHPKPKMIWIDNGASSQRLLEVQGGEFMDLSLDSGLCLNPFDLDPRQSRPTNSKMKLILAVLESILKEEENRGLPKREKALLEETIAKTYETCHPRVPTLSDLKKVLEGHPALQMQHFAQVLYSWTGNTAYGKMLDGPSTVQLTKDLITIEVKGLDSYPDLQNVLLLLLTDFIRREAARDLRTPYLLIIDEAWKLFETPSGRSFALEAYRTFRKYNGGIWCISQNYKDFLSSEEVKNAIFPNTTSLFILKQKKIDWKDFQQAMDFTHEETQVIKSLHIEKGKFSEFFFMQDENKAVLRLVPDPLSYWICTTDGNDKAKIQEIEAQHPNLTKMEVLKQIANSKTY